MIRTITVNGATELLDASDQLSNAELALVRAAMEAGLTEFTVPTPEDDEGRTDWSVRTWVTMKAGKPAAFLVARQAINWHFEVIGPQVNLGPSVAALPNAIREIAPVAPPDAVTPPRTAKTAKGK